jgi:two-component system phosphate regulon sensor histidine kinase PhoR
MGSLAGRIYRRLLLVALVAVVLTDLAAFWVLGAAVSRLPLLLLISLLLFGLIALACWPMSRLSARWLLRPFQKLDPQQPLSGDAYNELSGFLTGFNHAISQLREDNARLASSRREYHIVTDNMREGLVLINADGLVLFLNAAAAAIFNAADDRAGDGGEQRRHMLALDRSPGLQLALETVLLGSYAQCELELSKRFYHLLASPVHQDGQVSGAVLLLLDITERRLRDELRRQFSANVSHELKTPLTVISGYAELLQKGMIRPGDEQRIAAMLLDEARRLVAMINDILVLSHLDEPDSSTTPIDREFVEVDLLALSRETVGQLAAYAQERHIGLVVPVVGGVDGGGDGAAAVDGQPCMVSGVPSIISRMLQNLVENGIRYSDPGCQVRVGLRCEPEAVVLTVADDGIGIPAEYQEKVFERFFCVDPSRSRQVGGTGLGLAIVKHGALLHGANITLQSEVGKGTAVSLRFPRPNRT